MRITSILCVRNEDKYLRTTLRHLVDDNISIAIIDHDSTDGTAEILKEFEASIVYKERLPYKGYFDLQDQIDAKEDALRHINTDWVIHQDADEILQSPVAGESLRNGLLRASSMGFNCINFNELVFLPQNNQKLEGEDFYSKALHYYFFEPYPSRLMRAWLNNGSIKQTAAGHHLEGDDIRIFQENFILRHYPVLSQDHARSKYIKRVFSQADIARGWHTTRMNRDESEFILPDPNLLLKLDSADAKSFDRSTPLSKHFWEKGFEEQQQSTPDNIRSGLAIIDPCMRTYAGHHIYLNNQLIEGLSDKTDIVLFVDRELNTGIWKEQLPDNTRNITIIPCFNYVGYIGYEQMKSVERQLAYAQLFANQLQERCRNAKYLLAHTLLPYHLLGLAHFLCMNKEIKTFISFMFHPGEILDLQGLESPSKSNASHTISKMAIEKLLQHPKHKNVSLGCPSSSYILEYKRINQDIDLFNPHVHPSVSGLHNTRDPLGLNSSQESQAEDLHSYLNRAPSDKPRILLHLGTVKPDKGLKFYYELMMHLLSTPALGESFEFLFHDFSVSRPIDFQTLASRTDKELDNFHLIQRELSADEITAIVGCSDIIVIAHFGYVYKSSGVFWDIASRMFHSKRNPLIFCPVNTWVQEECIRCGIKFISLGEDPKAFLDSLTSCLTQATEQSSFTDYAETLFGRSFSSHINDTLLNS